MKKNMMAIVVFIAIFVFSAFCSGCSFIMTPPDTNTAESFIRDHERELQILIKYLLEQNNNSFYIIHMDGTALADLDHIRIEDEDVLQSIKSILADGCIEIYKDTEKNSIQFVLWTRTRDEADSGLLYAIIPGIMPEAEFQTEIVPLSKDGWYYYLAEYNKWRATRDHSTN